MGIETKVKKGTSSEQTSSSPSPAKGNRLLGATKGLGATNMTGTMATGMGQEAGSKGGKTMNDKARKERERRRRKMIVDVSKTQMDIENKRREELLVERNQRLSKQERELAYESWRTE
jgi:outer membrane protein TolC